MRVALIGTQWGDESKGRCVDNLIPLFDAVMDFRFQGGANAGHTIRPDKKDIVTHIVPSGILHNGVFAQEGSGMVIDPIGNVDEIRALINQGYMVSPQNLGIDHRAHVIFDYHMALDAHKEGEKSKEAVGSTGKGIGPAYTDKHARLGIRMGELCSPNFRDILFSDRSLKHLRNIYAMLEPDSTTSPEERAQKIYAKYASVITFLQPFLNDEIEALRMCEENGNVIFEGAQGTMLDVDYGTYPNVTSSNPTQKGLPVPVDLRYGVAKVYITRVGHGPFPTQMEPAIDEMVRQVGNEFGATTGRERRCGWPDLPVLRYAAAVNELDGIVLTKADVLPRAGLEQLLVCKSYFADGNEFSIPPVHDRVLMDQVVPAYDSEVEWKCWSSDIQTARRKADLPREFKEFARLVEVETNTPVIAVTKGPERENIVYLEQLKP